MSLRLQSVLSDFADRGITAADLSADELEALVFAVARVNDPYDRVHAELLEEPVRVAGGLFLWPITAGAQVWLAEYAEKWWPKTSRFHRWAHVHALLNARDPSAFPTEKAKARAAVVKSCLRLCVHPRELAAAMALCYGVRPHDAPAPERPKSKPDEQQDSFARFVAELEVKSGIPAAHWLWGRSLVSTLDHWRRMRTLAQALGPVREMDADLDDALENLARVKSAILEAHATSPSPSPRPDAQAPACATAPTIMKAASLLAAHSPPCPPAS